MRGPTKFPMFLIRAAEDLLVTTRVSQKINSVKNDDRASLFEQPELL